MTVENPRWNNTDRRKLIHPPETCLAILPSEASNSKSGEFGEGNDEFYL
jgi:hypothetical protein